MDHYHARYPWRHQERQQLHHTPPEEPRESSRGRQVRPFGHTLCRCHSSDAGRGRCGNRRQRRNLSIRGLLAMVRHLARWSKKRASELCHVMDRPSKQPTDRERQTPRRSEGRIGSAIHKLQFCTSQNTAANYVARADTSRYDIRFMTHDVLRFRDFEPRFYFRAERNPARLACCFVRHAFTISTPSFLIIIFIQQQSSSSLSSNEERSQPLSTINRYHFYS